RRHPWLPLFPYTTLFRSQASPLALGDELGRIAEGHAELAGPRPRPLTDEEGVATFLHDALRERDGMTDARDAGDRPVRETVAFHDGGVHLDGAVGGEHRAPAGIEARVVLERAHGRFHREHGAPAVAQDGPTRGHGLTDAVAQLVGAGGGIGARSTVDDERGHAACHGRVPAASIMGVIVREVVAEDNVPRGPLLELLARRISACRLCPRLVCCREHAAAAPPRRHRGERYWARPLPGFGDPDARVLLVGLAPAAHGGNRTGRMFTGDRSGDWLFASLYRCGFANQPTSVARDDGLRLQRAWVAAAVRCAPPVNRPLPSERDNCLPYLVRELGLLSSVRVIVALGSFAWDAALRTLAGLDLAIPRPRPKFGHGASAQVDRFTLLGCFH